jgi:hypothetical protein
MLMGNRDRYNGGSSLMKTDAVIKIQLMRNASPIFCT